MSTQRARTARELLAAAGRVTCLASVVALSMGAASVYAQNGQPAGGAPAMRDPMKPGSAPAGDDKGEAKVKVSEHNTVDLHVKDEELSNVLELLSIQTQKNIIASKNVNGKVTATLYGVTFDQAMSAILHVNGFTYMQNGNFIYVYTQEEYKQIEAALKKRVAKVIKLNYLNAEDAKEFVTPLLSKDGGEIKTNLKTKEFAIADKSPVGKDDFALGATLVVIDYEENIKAIEELVKQIDTRPAQVLVEATILQTAINEANAFGVDFSIIGDLNFSDFIGNGGPLSVANNLIKGGTGASGQGTSPTDNQGTGITVNPGNTGGPGTLKVGVVADDISIFLKMLDQVTDTQILSNPKILALNRQPARVLVGRRVGYLNTTSTETSTTQTVEFLDTGTQLYFRPFVSSEGEIRMELKPQVSAAEIRTVTDAGGAAVTIPDEVTQELVTNVNVRDGQTIVLGGLFSETTSFTRRQVPWLGDLPIIGTAFRGNEDSTNRNEIIFLITPSIVTDASVAEAAERAGSDIERLRAGSRQGLLPWSQTRMTGTLNVEAEKLAREGKYEEALESLRRSLALQPDQPEAYRLRERITGEKEQWDNRSTLENAFNAGIKSREQAITPSPTPMPHQRPKGHIDGVRVPVNGARSAMNTGPMSTDPLDAAIAASLPASSPSETTTTTTDGSTTASAAETTNATDPSGMNSGEAIQSTDPALQPSDTTASGEPLSQAFDPNTVTPAGNVPATTDGQPMAAATTSAASSNAPGTVAPAQPMNEVAAARLVQLTLPNLRGQIEMFSLMNEQKVPPLGTGNGNGWETFVSSKMIKEAPRNDYIGGLNANKVVLGSKPDTSFHTNYGWIFNPSTGQLWAAGFDATDKPISKATASAAPVTPATTVAEAQPQPEAPGATSTETTQVPEEPEGK